MSLHQAPLQGTLNPGIATPYVTSTRVQGRRLLLLRLGWTLLTFYNLVLFFVSIPAYHASLFVLCTDPRLLGRHHHPGQITEAFGKGSGSCTTAGCCNGTRA